MVDSPRVTITCWDVIAAIGISLPEEDFCFTGSMSTRNSSTSPVFKVQLMPHTVDAELSLWPGASVQWQDTKIQELINSVCLCLTTKSVCLCLATKSLSRSLARSRIFSRNNFAKSDMFLLGQNKGRDVLNLRYMCWVLTSCFLFRFFDNEESFKQKSSWVYASYFQIMPIHCCHFHLGILTIFLVYGIKVWNT